MLKREGEKKCRPKEIEDVGECILPWGGSRRWV